MHAHQCGHRQFPYILRLSELKLAIRPALITSTPYTLRISELKLVERAETWPLAQPYTLRISELKPVEFAQFSILYHHLIPYALAN